MRWREVGCAERERAQHHRLGARRAQDRHGVLADAAVGGQHDAPPGPAGRDERLGFGQAGGSALVQALPLHADRGPEKREKAQAREEPCHPRHRRLDPEHHSGRNAEPLEKVERRVRDTLVLQVEAQEVAAGVGELLDLGQKHRIRHHEVHVQRQRRRLAHRRHQIGKEQEGRREMPVRDVDMQDVGMRTDTVEVVLQPDEVGRPERELADQPVARQRVRSSQGSRVASS